MNFKKGFLAVLFLLFITNNVFAQGMLEPVKWTTEVEKISENNYNLIFKAKIDKGWKIYAQDVPEGPIPTTIIFKESAEYSLVGKTLELGSSTTEIDDIFGTGEMMKKFKETATFTQQISTTNPDLVINTELEFMVCEEGRCLPPEIVDFAFSLNKKKVVKETTETLTESCNYDLGVKGKDKFIKEETSSKSNSTIFFLGFLGGLLALLTPCVFPMIPMTVSYFTKGSEDKSKGIRDALLYAFFIILIYFLLSIPFHILDNVDENILNNISTSVGLNIFFFVIFIFFALSFFGYYDLTLPSSWSNKMDEKASKFGGIIGVFFMALTLAIVSFSCTGPILGSLLGGALTSENAAFQLTYGMLGFGVALALPFGLFAFFPHWLNKLQSGSWLNTMKVVLGFLELGLAFKFLSKADLIGDWNILKREVFIGIWIVIGIGLALYIFGKIKFPHDSPIKKLNFSRISFGVLVTAFVIYLIPGLTNSENANLKLISGFTPPLFYSVYDKATNCPLDLECHKNDLDAAIASAKKNNKPILIDFTGKGCENCRKMEEQVWSQSSIFNKINEEFVLVSLYVDTRKELSEEQQCTYIKPNGKSQKVRNLGNINAAIQLVNFGVQSQPYYVLIDAEMNMLNYSVGYTPNEDEFKSWLDIGLENYKKTITK